MLTGGKAFQLLTEVFHHIIAFGFAVDQHVQAECFLFTYAALNFCVHRGAIGKVIQLTGLVLTTISADFFRLGERTYRGGREEWQIQFFGLQFQTLLRSPERPRATRK